MRIRFFALALATLSLLTLLPGASSRALAEEQGAQVSAEWADDKVDLPQLFDAVVDAVDKNFFDKAALAQGNWRERAQEMRPSALASPSIDDAVRQINQLLSGLGVSHTGLYTPNDYLYYVLLDVTRGLATRDFVGRRFWSSGLYYPGIGIFTRNVDGHDFVDGVLEGSPAEKAGLKFGDEILSVDGQPYHPIEAFRKKIGAAAELMIRRTAGAAPERLTATVIPIRPVQAFSDATEASARIIERNGRRIGYVHVWALAESNSFAKALSAFSPYPSRYSLNMTFSLQIPITGEMPKPVDAVIVDLRGRVGGNMDVAGQLLKYLDASGSYSYWGAWQTRPKPSGPVVVGGPLSTSFRGRSALLIDAQTRSAGEIMAYGYKHSTFGPLFGTRTAGAVMSGALYPMPGDMLLHLATAGHEFDGHSLEGTGVTPDYQVEHPLPYAQGADPVLEAAADFLAKAKQ